MTQRPDQPPADRPPRARERVPSRVLVHTGDGKGKTSAAMGVVMRAVARGWRVSVVQFVKDGRWKTGEEASGRELGAEWWSIGDGFTWDSTDMDRTEAIAREAWSAARDLIRAGEHELVVLDEITYPMNWGWIDVERGHRDDPGPAVAGERRRDRPGRAGRTLRRRRHRDGDGERQARVRLGCRGDARDRVLMGLTVLLGGARSGKSALATRLASAAEGPVVRGRDRGGSGRGDDRADPETPRGPTGGLDDRRGAARVGFGAR